MGISIAYRQFNCAPIAVIEAKARFGMYAAFEVQGLARYHPRGGNIKRLIVKLGLGQARFDDLARGDIIRQKSEIIQIEIGFRVRAGLKTVGKYARIISEEILLAGCLIGSEVRNGCRACPLSA